MYVPPAFQETRPEVLRELMEQHAFATLVTVSPDGEPYASHLPMLPRPGPPPHGTLWGHVARANPQWRHFREAGEVLVVFSGPHGYVSPSWYAAERAVPTWNYAVVHARGVPRRVEDPETVGAYLEALAARYESAFPEPWRLDRLPAEYVRGLQEAIVTFEIPLRQVEGKLKLSQNRSRADREGVLAGLEAAGDAASLELAAWMRRFAPPE